MVVTFSFTHSQPYTKWSRFSGKSKFAHLRVPFTNDDGSADDVNLFRLDLVGNQYQRGFDHGAMLAKEIVHFSEIALSKFFVDAVMNLDLSKYPEELQQILKIVQIKGAIAAPEAVNKAMAWVYKSEQAYMPRWDDDDNNDIIDSSSEDDVRGNVLLCMGFTR